MLFSEWRRQTRGKKRKKTWVLLIGLESTTFQLLSATFSTRDELTQLTTTWEISNISLAFLHIKISIEGNGLCTSVCLLLTFRFTYWLVVLIFASITSLVFYFFSQFLRLCRLFSDDSDFSLKLEALPIWNENFQELCKLWPTQIL